MERGIETPAEFRPAQPALRWGTNSTQLAKSEFPVRRHGQLKIEETLELAGPWPLWRLASSPLA